MTKKIPYFQLIDEGKEILSEMYPMVNQWELEGINIADKYVISVSYSGIIFNTFKIPKTINKYVFFDRETKEFLRFENM